MTPRVQRLRQSLLSRDLLKEWPAARGDLARAALAASMGQPQPLRIATVLDRVFREVPVVIRPDELLVGCRGAVGYPEIDDAIAHGSAEYPYMIADFETLLTQGVNGVQARAEARLRGLDEADPAQMEAVHFLKAVVTACAAVVAWAERYAAEAERQAQAESDPARRAELLAIAARCRRVPASPPESFADAVQSVWFLYVALYLETLAMSCLGRLDQYLLPFYRRDLAAGRITREQAGEWLCCLWLKLYENVQGVIGSHAQTVTLGGLLPDGSSGVNELSFLCLDVAESVGNAGAQIAIRWFDGEDAALVAGAFRLVEKRVVMPQLFNDHTYLAALARLGVPFADAATYALFGCHEPVISGMGYQRPASWPGYVSFYDWLEQALGLESFGSPPQLRVVAPPPATVEELWTRWEERLGAGIRAAVIRANFGDQIKREMLPRPLMSAFLRDCIDRGADLTAGGARYNMTGFQGCALATAVDAFLAVRDLVFERREVSMPELIAALQADFAGHDNLLRRLLHEPPKYGTDNDAADAVATRIVAAFCREIETHRNARGGRFTSGLWSFLQNVHFGKRTAASPDGRRAGQPISHSMDPVSGQAVRGPTAVLKSAAKLAQDRLANGGSLLLEFAPSVMADPGTRATAQALCESYFRMGGIQLQLSSSSVAQLRAAQRDPEHHRDLVVRVAGYSDFFTRLTPDLQEYIIRREKHEV